MAIARRHHRDWVVVADGEKALLLENPGDDKYPHLDVLARPEQENPPTRSQGTDRPGRAGDIGRGRRSAVAFTDWHRLAKDRFASGVANLLYTYANAGAFRRLMPVAAPKMLGQVRYDLHAEVRDKVVMEVPEPLTHHLVDEI